ncbi:uncharacterized protein LOC129592198 [Paramacrobiotus metropolitanus]|uniref:uncharacterized protein LOC129592198 n=1 Tax=Paramacrobiotus metropolitanus TaxID=2943436 RepID=UPI0024464E8B|nr:uncharacterized protein LOC129592198 [Paramacrobiotus metropolitanus]
MMSHDHLEPMATCSDSEETFNQKRKRWERDEKVPRTGESNSVPDDSPNSSFPDGKPMKALEKPNVLKYSERPDTNVLKTTVILNKIIVRTTELANHVLVMGTVSYSDSPVKCPYGAETNACNNVKFVSTDRLKAHLEVAHQLPNVQINLLCPCPAECNGDKECPVAIYDQYSGLYLVDHLTEAHEQFYNKLQALLCCVDVDDDDDQDDLEAFLKENNLNRKDMDYLKHLDGRKTFPEWTRDVTKPFQSQLIPDKFVQPTVVENRCLYYVCNLEPCKGNRFPSPRRIRSHICTVHLEQVPMQTDLYFGCPAPGCKDIVKSNTNLIISHVKAMHPSLCGRPDYSQNALQKRERMIMEMDSGSVRVSQTLDDSSEDSDDSSPDSEKEEYTRYLYKYSCPAEGCTVVYWDRDYMIWHIGADHQKIWTTA